MDLSHRAVLSVSGADRLSWLNSITSQSLAALSPGVSTETLLLDQRGRVEYAAHVVDDGVTIWLLLEREEAPRLTAWLNAMKFALRVEVADRSDEFATIGTMGSRGCGSPHRTAPRSSGTIPGRPCRPAATSTPSATRTRQGHGGGASGWCRGMTSPHSPGKSHPARAGRRAAGLRGAANRRVAAAVRHRGGREDDPARTRLAALRRPPAQGLLPRTGNRREGAQPGASAATPRAAAPGRLRGGASRGGGCGHRSTARSSAA